MTRGPRSRESDSPVIIIGAGLAGLSTALHLAPHPCVVLSAAAPGEGSASGWAQGGIAAALDPADSPADHARDTIAAGAGLSDPAMVSALTAAAPAAIDWLEAIGARFDRHPDGRLHLGLEGAHGRHRIVHRGGDGSGAEVMRAVVDATRGTDSITVLTGTTARRLVLRDGQVCGVLVQDSTGTRLLRSARVVLATGGSGALFAHTTNPRGARGQGLALAARAGAVLRDLEMVQFHPTALDVGLDPMPLVSEAVRGEGAVLVDARGERLVSDDLAARDVVARAVWAHVSRGAPVFLDTRDAIGDRLAVEFPAVDAACRAAGIDPTREPIPVRPAAHYHCGGVLVSREGRSTVPGLWAVGEVASTGMHGANRLASNSLLEAVVGGAWAADDLTDDPGTHGAGPGPLRLSETDAPNPSGHRQSVQGRPQRTWVGLRSLMSSAAGVVRTGTELTQAVDTLTRRVERYGLEDVDDATLVGLMLCTSALSRTESRGGHLRLDEPAAQAVHADGAAEHSLITLSDVVSTSPALLTSPASAATAARGGAA